MDPRTQLLVYCRGGFEGEALLELEGLARETRTSGQGVAVDRAGYLLFRSPEAGMMLERIPFKKMTFARHVVAVDEQGEDLDRGDRIAGLKHRLGRIAQWTGPFANLWMGWPDSEEGRVLAPLGRILEARLRQEMLDQGMLLPDSGGPRAEVVFLSGLSALVGNSLAYNGSLWPMGIPRLRLPAGSPSRSALKLEEALAFFIPHGENGPRPGQTVVDLGAAPGGWTLAMLRRGLKVTAVDRGALADIPASSPKVQHVSQDGFHFQPPRPVDWLLCDILDKPRRVAELVAKWSGNGWCQRAIFNLKLPMKLRFQEVTLCQQHITDSLKSKKIPFHLRFQQLYHDREEVTGFLERISPLHHTKSRH